MEQAFANYGIFRIGDAERILRIMSAISLKRRLEERITLLQELMKDASVNMAVGAIWKEKATMELRRAFT